MQDCQDLLSQLRRRGVKLWTESGQLYFSAPKGTLTAEDLTALREEKSAMLVLLEEAELLSGVPLHARPAPGPFPLTALQMRQWAYTTERRAGRSERTCIVAQRVTGHLDIPTLRDTLHQLGQRHQALRLQIVRTENLPRQALTELSPDLEVIDLRKTAQPCMAVTRLCEDFARRPVDLHGRSLVAAKLFKLTADDHVLLILMHHMISDAVSCQIVSRECWASYRAAKNSVHAPLPALPFQFPDYVAWQHRTHRAWIAKHASYWTSHLADLYACNRLKQPGELEPIVFAKRTLTLDSTLSRRLRELACSSRRLISLVVLASYVSAISRWLRWRDFVLAFVTNARDRSELQHIVGFIADYLHLRVRIEEREPFTVLLERLALEFNAACAHQDYGRVPDLVPECQPEIGFNWLPEGEAEDASSRHGNAPVEELPHVGPFPLKLAFPLPPPRTISALFRDAQSGIGVTVAYRPDVFTAEQIEEFIQILQTLISELMKAEPPPSCTEAEVLASSPFVAARR